MRLPGIKFAERHCVTAIGPMTQKNVYTPVSYSGGFFTAMSQLAAISPKPMIPMIEL
jgi:hypothetical protein